MTTVSYIFDRQKIKWSLGLYDAHYGCPGATTTRVERCRALDRYTSSEKSNVFTIPEPWRLYDRPSARAWAG